MKSPAPQPFHRLLVIGYGNGLRSDDGVGPRVAEAIEEMQLPGVGTLSCALLTPELAEPVSKAQCVIFVDAAVDLLDKIHLRPLAPAGSAQIMAHAADPRTVLALAGEIFGHAPQAWWLTIPAESLEVGDKLSAKAQAGASVAVTEIQRILRNLP